MHAPIMYVAPLPFMMKQGDVQQINTQHNYSDKKPAIAN